MSPPKHPLPATGTPKPPPDKSKFLQTCNRLSLFLKEKGNIRDLNFNFDATATGAKATTVDLLSSIDDEPGEKSAKSPPPPPPPPPPQYAVILDSSSCQVEDSKPKSAQMTIFYEGEVLVLDDVPADRARDLMVMANKGGQKEDRASKPPPVDVSGDLPIARRASLHKFLAKRKDRATVRQPHPHPHPYRLHSPAGSPSSSANEQHSFDLNM